MAKLFFPKTNLATPLGQGADFVELFFDLVFVFAITQITALVAHHLDAKHVLQSILMFWLIWWGWTQFTWALNAANTKIAGVRMTVLIATAVAFVMAASSDEGFTAGVLWFAVPYIIIRAIGIGLYIRVTSNLEGQVSAVIKFATLSVGGLVAVLAGAFASPEVRVYWWLGAIFLDFMAAFMAGDSDDWGLQANHFAERHGLIVIIALGESLIVAAAGVSGQDRSMDLMIAGGLTVVVTCLLWWCYFAWMHEFLEEHLSSQKGGRQSAMARDVYSFIHFPLVCGIIGIAVGFEKIVAHPHDLITLPVVAALGGGYALFVGSTAFAVWRASRQLLWPRIIVFFIATAVVFFCVGHPPAMALSVLAFSLFLLIFIEWRNCEH